MYKQDRSPADFYKQPIKDSSYGYGNGSETLPIEQGNAMGSVEWFIG